MIKKKGGEGVERGKGLSCQSVEEEGARRICKLGGGGGASLPRSSSLFLSEGGRKFVLTGHTCPDFFPLFQLQRKWVENSLEHACPFVIQKSLIGIVVFTSWGLNSEASPPLDTSVVRPSLSWAPKNARLNVNRDHKRETKTSARGFDFDLRPSEKNAV